MDSDHDQLLTLRPPTDRDGLAVHRLIEACPPLDPNSLYCNFLQCTHFAATCALAESAGEDSAGKDTAPVGFLSGYRPPERPETLFVWQVAIARSHRGQGLARRLIESVLERRCNADITHLEATITGDNIASWKLFESLARRWDAKERREPLFDRDVHFGGSHGSEWQITIGPFRAASLMNRKKALAG